MKRKVALMMHAVNEQHLIYYSVSLHQNMAYTDGELYEYGIRCMLCDLRGKLLDEKNVTCVSSDFNLVCQVVNVLAGYQVYPVHILEILDDLMTREELPKNEEETSSCLCV